MATMKQYRHLMQYCRLPTHPNCELHYPPLYTWAVNTPKTYMDIKTPTPTNQGGF